MTQTIIQKGFAPFKRYLPRWAYNPIRSVATALIGPALFLYQSGYFVSCFKMAAISKSGEPIPWYTYPSIDFLKSRLYEDRMILEFGGGQSSLWWAKRAKGVVTLEGDREWHDKIRQNMPDNVELHYVSMENSSVNVSQVNGVLKSKAYSQYDVIIIDGLYREEMIQIAIGLMTDDGMIICDNAESYGFYEGFKETGLSRVDFVGNAPGIVLPHCTSIYFKPSTFAFGCKFPIPDAASDLRLQRSR